MKARKTMLMLALAWQGVTAEAQVQNNEAQQKALEVLRRTIEGMEPRQPGKPSPPGRRELTFTEAEGLFLQDKMSAKEFQKYLEEHKPDSAPSEAAAPGAAPAPDQSNLTELERKMDELLRLKAARENSAATNVVSNTTTNSAVPAAPKTKRERLNELLLLVVAGKITDAEYKEKRAKLINEPE